MHTEQQISESERRRRRELNENTRVGIALGLSIEQVVERREKSTLDWMAWLNAKMVEQKADDPQQIMPSICARLEERGALVGREAAKIAAKEEVQRMLRKAIT
jgi:hypothetical protein